MTRGGSIKMPPGDQGHGRALTAIADDPRPGIAPATARSFDWPAFR